MTHANFFSVVDGSPEEIESSHDFCWNIKISHVTRRVFLLGKTRCRDCALMCVVLTLPLSPTFVVHTAFSDVSEQPEKK